MDKMLKAIAHKFLKDYGNYFKQQRLKAELSQDEVAKLIGCSQAIISHIECGYMLPSKEIEQKLINVYLIRKES